MINLVPIKIKKEQLKYERKNIYRKIFKQLCDTVNMNAHNGNTFCVYKVPEFFFDEITYPLDECIEYLNKKLAKYKEDKNIVEITFYVPNLYFIKWEI